MFTAAMRPAAFDQEERATQARTVLPPSEGAVGTFLVLTEAGALRWPVYPGRALTIGRAPDCDVCIDHPSVSRHHAVLEAGPPLTLKDVGSSNGTHVGAKRLENGEVALLKPGVVIELGAVFAVWQPSAAEGHAPIDASDVVRGVN